MLLVFSYPSLQPSGCGEGEKRSFRGWGPPLAALNP